MRRTKHTLQVGTVNAMKGAPKRVR